nr:MAG TPA: hypothetical protein [Caudoviricetes sp.]DAU41904.1 MAG TPA: hypothetical protein [Caudoviricetes sp.]
MTVQELMDSAAFRNRLSDNLQSGYDNDELIAYINDAINFMWHVLIKNGYYEVIGDAEFTAEENNLPTDWYRATNQAPILIKPPKAIVYGKRPIKVRYYKRPPQMREVTDTLPFTNNAFNNLIGQLVIILAMSNHGFNMDVEQDMLEAVVGLL